MITYKRELRTKFEEIITREAIFCSDGLELSSPCKEKIEAFAEMLAEAVVSMRRVHLEKAGPEWAILAGMDISQSQIDKDVEDKKATDSFEHDLHFNPLAWDKNKEWQTLRDFVIIEYSKDHAVWNRYDQWRKGKGKYAGAMNNKNILERPLDFIRAFPDFLAHTSMNGEPQIQSRNLNG